MATLTNYTAEKKYEHVEPTPTVIDMEIMEHIYSATMDEILGDDGLMTIILSEGFYMAALCEASCMNTMTVKTKDGRTVTLHAPAPEQPMIYDMVTLNTKFSMPTLKLKNNDLSVDVDQHIKDEEIKRTETEMLINMGKIGAITDEAKNVADV